MMMVAIADQTLPQYSSNLSSDQIIAGINFISSSNFYERYAYLLFDHKYIMTAQRRRISNKPAVLLRLSGPNPHWYE